MNGWLLATAVFVSIALGVVWLTALSNFLFFPKLRVPHRRTIDNPSLSVLIPARNEAASIGKTIQSLLGQSVTTFELLILDDQSEDETGAIARAWAARDERVRVLNGRPLPTGWLGKNWACHQLAQAAQGERLLFLDADVRCAPEAMMALLTLRKRLAADLLTVWPTQLSETWGERLIIPQIALAILAYLPILGVHFTPFAAFAAANGQCMLFTRRAYVQIGGHASVRDAVVEDVALARAIKRSGLRLRMADGSRLVCCRMYQNWPGVRDGLAKNLLAGHGNSILFLTTSTLFHLLIFVFPWIWLLYGGGAWAVALGLGGMGLRGATAVFTRQRLQDALLMPLSVLLMTRIAWRSVRWRVQGNSEWKGRKV